MRKSFYYLTVCTLAIVGCSKEIETPVDIETPNINANSKGQVTIYASINDTKTTVDGTGIYSWQASEKISVVEQDATSSAEFELTDAETGAFTGTKSADKDLVFAVSPKAALTDVDFTGGLMYGITLPSFYTDYIPGTTNAVMLGKPNGGSYKFTFDHIAPLMKFTYANVPIGTKKFVFGSTENELTGSWLFDSVDGVTLDIADASSKGSEVTLELKDAVYEANQTMEFYVPVPIATYKDFLIELQDGSSTTISGTSKTKSGLSIPLAAGDIFPCPIVNLPVAAKGAEWTHTFTDKGELVTKGATVNGLTVTSTVNCDQIESSGSARGAAFQSSADPTITIPYTGYIESVVIVCSTNNGSNKISVKVDDISLGSEQSITNGSPNETHTFKIATPTRYRKGDVKIIVNNSGSKSTWIKSITINSDVRGAANLSYAVASMDVPTGASPFINPLTNPNSLTGIVYTSSNPSIAAVDSESGEVTVGSTTGTARITASFAGNESFKEGSAYYDIEVVAPVYVNYWVNGVKTTVAAAEGQSLDTILPATPSCGIVGYQFDGWSESAVSATDTKPSYTSATDVPAVGITLYAVFVKVGSEDVPATPVSFVPDNCASSAGKYTHSDSSNGVEITVSSGICNETQFRIYKSATLKITSSSRNITDVDVTGVSDNPASNFNTPTGWTTTISDADGNWHTSNTTKTITLTASSAQVRATEIVVTLAAYSRATYSGYTTSPTE